ncbi:sugar transferase [Robiginitalea sp.]|jgi:lipopolysaccharide/colanic/teichoic acid biosynthesis glycosyltransferase|nr:sugar transferase [Robiginitalea sp.]
MYRNFFKRVIDILLSLIGLLVLFPIFFVLWAILMFVNKGKPFFTQRRPGRNEKVFSILKFKSMTDATDKDGKLLPEELRVTKFGNFMRNTSLDEIPQLVSVLKGDMSLIGPRPLRVRYLDYYTLREKTRHDVRPGITGLAQISGRNALEWDDRLELDAQYVEQLSFWLDFKIFFLTIIGIFQSKNQVLNMELKPLDYNREKLQPNG